jgi:N-acyl-D-amino-acid deacylase
MRTIRETEAQLETGKSMEDIIGTSMSEDDVSWFVAHPEIAFCSDGALHGSHPRGAGAFPRILGHYVREAKVLPLPEAIRKMTSLPASRLGLSDRGRIAPGYVAVMVSGEWVIRDGAVTGKRPGKALQGPGYRAAR